MAALRQREYGRLESGVGYRLVVLTLPEQLCIPFYKHSDQNKLYSRFMALAQACLEEFEQDKLIGVNPG
jgi:hypothetical protein